MNKIKYLEQEINYIKDSDKREDIKYLINLIPDYFFSEPSIGPKYATLKNGLLKRTKVSVRLAYDLFKTVNNFIDEDKDLIIMALILHDGLERGIEEDKKIKVDHPLLISKLILEHAGDLKMDMNSIRRICSMIECHMGEYNKDLPKPRDEYQRFVYRCDYLASRDYLNIKFDKLNII